MVVFEPVCDRRCVNVQYNQRSYRLWWVCHLIFEDLYGFLVWVRLFYKHPSITFPTNAEDKSQAKKKVPVNVKLKSEDII